LNGKVRKFCSRELHCALGRESSQQFAFCGSKRQFPVIHHVLQIELGLHV
jgi:hypothetical protein